MTPNDQVRLKDSAQLRTAVAMFLDYLLQHKELLQTAIQKHHAKGSDSVSTQAGEKQIEDTSRMVNDQLHKISGES
jgi:hypothetical protein